MSEEGSSSAQEGKVEGAINAVTGLVEAIPIYQDAIQPAAKEVGKVLELVGRTVNAALMPIQAMVWGAEQMKEFVNRKVSSKLKNVPPENIITPDLSVAGPTLESLRFSGHNDSLCELYANLLASSMDKETAQKAHPGFVEIIRSLSSDEARLLAYIHRNSQIPVVDVRVVNKTEKSFRDRYVLVTTSSFHAGCENLDGTPSYLTNLSRLGLVSIDKSKRLLAGAYEEIESEGRFKETLSKISTPMHETEIIKYVVEVTPFGRQFGATCIDSKS